MLTSFYNIIFLRLTLPTQGHVLKEGANNGEISGDIRSGVIGFIGHSK